MNLRHYHCPKPSRCQTCKQIATRRIFFYPSRTHISSSSIQSQPSVNTESRMLVLYSAWRVAKSGRFGIFKQAHRLWTRSLFSAWQRPPCGWSTTCPARLHKLHDGPTLARHGFAAVGPIISHKSNAATTTALGFSGQRRIES